MKKRILAIILIVVALISVIGLVGCNDDKGGGQGGGQDGSGIEFIVKDKWNDGGGFSG